MSEERRKRQQEREDREPGPTVWRRVAVAIAVLAAFAGAYYLGQRKRVSTLDAFAQCVAGKGAKMYGLFWCEHCAEQKEMFGSSFQYIPYVECGVKGSHQEEANCAAAGLKNFPTWQFADGERKEGPQSMQFLSQKTGCKLP